MISRHWKGIIKSEETENYVRHLKMDTFPQLATIKGFIEAVILKRAVDQGMEFLIITTWDSIDAISQFAGEKSDVAVIPPMAQAMMVEFDSFVVHYEIEPMY